MSGAAPDDRPLGKRIGDQAINATLMAALGAMRLLPYETRLRAFANLTTTVIAPMAGWRKRIRDNLDLVWPDLPEAEKTRLVRAVPAELGRTVMEFFSPDEFRARLKGVTFEGPGADALHAAARAKRPLILVSGHHSDYGCIGILMSDLYGGVGTLYRPLSNAPFNAHYVAAMEAATKPLFPRTRRGLAEMVKYLRAGNPVAILHDQHMDDGLPLRFFGQTAMTAPSPAEMALKYDAPLIPVYAVRQPDGLSFRVEVEAPVPPSDPATMMQALNDSLEARVRANPDQWMWIHRRWRAVQEGRR
ncbi:lysophospholipid acyltransferase family protein [Pseudooceanicola sp. LIPI14-2-Ac024]|uniref:lysophospholipid acyltransferase family protein n=1 Tax=Pseudooceanicola sp. LIPI14-2-Ac024 TaxID=3344875 RepID=UPI0035CF6329